MTPLRWAMLTFAGMVMAQAAWMLALPPYQAIDEFDHVFRAAGVASGQWRLTEVAPEGRGMTVVVPGETVAAATPQCAALPYTGPDNCFPIDEYQNGQVLIATAAGGYNPVYYWMIGSLAKPFEGDAANYAMRAASAVICSFGVAFAAFCLGLQRAGPWTRVGFVVSLTPVLIYTTVIPAPNAWEIVAGLCLWASLLAVLRGELGPRPSSLLVGAATLSACVLVTPRMLGPMWLGLILVVLAVYVGLDAVRSAVLRNFVSWVLGSALVVAVTAAAAWWTLTAGLTQTSAQNPKTLAEVAIKPLVWTLGVVGAFPFRDQPAPLPAYGLYLTVVGAMLWYGVRRSRSRERVAILLAVSMSLAVPMALTLMTMHDRGTIWQGRYGLPLIVGILLLVGPVLDRVSWAGGERYRLGLLGLAMLGVAQAWCVITVLEFETARVSTVPSPHWVTAPSLVVGILMLAAWAVLCAGPAAALRVESVGELGRGPDSLASRAGVCASGDPARRGDAEV